jgi:hypothetical protein
MLKASLRVLKRRLCNYKTTPLFHFIGLDIHKKKLDSFHQLDLFFTRPIRCPSHAEICNVGAFSGHADDLVWGCCGSQSDQ